MGTVKELFSIETLEWARRQEEQLKCLSYRPEKENLNRETGRDDYERDYARILYSSSFRRLQGKMQLLGIDSSHFHRNRLTHSLEVAQIARSIARKLRIKENIVTESASLAHDLGNPPFGHKGETVLNRLSDNVGGFEGNAQTFRILRKLEKKHSGIQGLNLMMRTLFATVKYYNKRGDGQDKFLYDEDYGYLSDQLSRHSLCLKKSIDAQIMDLADEIAYAAHDLEDALSFNLLTLGEIMHEFRLSKEYADGYDALKEIVNHAQFEAAKSKRMNSSEEFSAIRNKELTSLVVNTLMNDLDEHAGELTYTQHQKLAKGLKKLLFKALLRKDRIQVYELKGKKIIEGLFEVYTNPGFNEKNLLFPAELRESGEPIERIAVDYISGMMDSFAEQQYMRFFGKKSLDALYR